MNRRATLHDVAAMAGVSIKTVSRVVNNESTVAPTTVARVMKAIDALDYVPNTTARALVEGRSRTICFVTGVDPYSLFSSTLVANILQDTRRRGYSLLLIQGGDNAAENVGRALLGRQADGFILLSRASEDADLIGRLSDLDIPWVVAHPTSPQSCREASCVLIDEVSSVREATAYLIGLGHRTIGIVSHPLFTAAGVDRLRGYREALDEAGIPFRSELVFEADLPFSEVGYLGATELIRQHRDVTAVFGFTDEIAIGAISAVWQLGLKVPDDVSVIGFNDTPLAALVHPPLTTVHVPLDEISRTAVDLIVDTLEQRTPERVGVVVPTAITIRGSCCSPRGVHRPDEDPALE